MAQVRLLWLVALPVWLPGQMLIDPSTQQGKALTDAFRASLKNARVAATLGCQITEMPPRLGFDFRLWSGYQLLLSAKPFGGKAAEAVIFSRVRSKLTGTEYLFSSGRFPIPAVESPKGRQFFYEGGFFVGPGDYEVDFLAVDRENRFCAKHWSIKARAGKVEVKLEPGTVASLAPARWRGFPAGEERSGRLTVLLHASPVVRRRNAVKLSSVDRMVLLSSLVSVLERTRFRQARVVAFDLDGRRTLYEAADFTAQSYRGLVRALSSANFGTIDIQKLNHARPDRLLADLLEKEQNAQEQSEAIVFLGPAHRLAGKMIEDVRDVKLELPPTYYFTFSYLRMSPEDWIDRVVKKLARGKTFAIATPEDLSKAIERLRM